MSIRAKHPGVPVYSGNPKASAFDYLDHALRFRTPKTTMDLLLAAIGSTDCKYHGRSISVGSPLGTWPSTLVKTEVNNREAKSAGRILTHLVISLSVST